MMASASRRPPPLPSLSLPTPRSTSTNLLSEFPTPPTHIPSTPTTTTPSSPFFPAPPTTPSNGKPSRSPLSIITTITPATPPIAALGPPPTAPLPPLPETTSPVTRRIIGLRRANPAQDVGALRRKVSSDSQGTSSTSVGVSDEWEGEMMMSTSTSATSVASRGSLVLKESGEEDEHETVLSTSLLSTISRPSTSASASSSSSTITQAHRKTSHPHAARQANPNVNANSNSIPSSSASTASTTSAPPSAWGLSINIRKSLPKSTNIARSTRSRSGSTTSQTSERGETPLDTPLVSSRPQTLSAAPSNNRSSAGSSGSGVGVKQQRSSSSSSGSRTSHGQKFGYGNSSTRMEETQRQTRITPPAAQGSTGQGPSQIALAQMNAGMRARAASTASTSTSISTSAQQQHPRPRAVSSTSRTSTSTRTSTRRTSREGSTSPDIANLIERTPTPSRKRKQSAVGKSRQRATSGSSLGAGRTRSTYSLASSNGGTGTASTRSSGVLKRGRSTPSFASSSTSASQPPSIPLPNFSAGAFNPYVDDESWDTSFVQHPAFLNGDPSTNPNGGMGVNGMSSRPESEFFGSQESFVGDEEWDDEEVEMEGDEDMFEEEMLDGRGESDEDVIDLRTPLPHLMLRAGFISPHSKLLPRPSPSPEPLPTPDITNTGTGLGGGMGTGDGRESPVGSLFSTSSKHPRDARDTAKRRERHKDGKLLRGGIGLTTGLGWSDSEDEDAPSELTNRLSRLAPTLSRKSSLAQSVYSTTSMSVADLSSERKSSVAFPSGSGSGRSPLGVSFAQGTTMGKKGSVNSMRKSSFVSLGGGGDLGRVEEDEDMLPKSMSKPLSASVGPGSTPGYLNARARPRADPSGSGTGKSVYVVQGRESFVSVTSSVGSAGGVASGAGAGRRVSSASSASGGSVRRVSDSSAVGNGVGRVDEGLMTPRKSEFGLGVNAGATPRPSHSTSTTLPTSAAASTTSTAVRTSGSSITPPTTSRAAPTTPTPAPKHDSTSSITSYSRPIPPSRANMTSPPPRVTSPLPSFSLPTRAGGAYASIAIGIMADGGSSDDNEGSDKKGKGKEREKSALPYLKEKDGEEAKAVAEESDSGDELEVPAYPYEFPMPPPSPMGVVPGAGKALPPPSPLGNGSVVNVAGANGSGPPREPTPSKLRTLLLRSNLGPISPSSASATSPSTFTSLGLGKPTPTRGTTLPTTPTSTTPPVSPPLRSTSLAIATPSSPSSRLSTLSTSPPNGTSRLAIGNRRMGPPAALVLVERQKERAQNATAGSGLPASRLRVPSDAAETAKERPVSKALPSLPSPTASTRSAIPAPAPPAPSSSSLSASTSSIPPPSALPRTLGTGIKTPSMSSLRQPSAGFGSAQVARDRTASNVGSGLRAPASSSSLGGSSRVPGPGAAGNASGSGLKKGRLGVAI